MPLVTGRRLEFRFRDLATMSLFLRHLRLHDREHALAEAAKAHFGSLTVTATLFSGDDGAAARAEASSLGGTELGR